MSALTLRDHTGDWLEPPTIGAEPFRSGAVNAEGLPGPTFLLAPQRRLRIDPGSTPRRHSGRSQRDKRH
jgi:hypothetical protein